MDIRSLLSSGIYASAMVKQTDLSEFIPRLRPMAFNRPLVRIGGDGDGGYLLVDDFEGIDFCYSPGVGGTSAFENHIRERYDIWSHLADASVEPPVGLQYASYTKKFVGIEDNEREIKLSTWIGLTCSQARHHAAVVHSVDGSTAKTVPELILQMDIEGSEYAVLLETPAELFKRFRQIVIEFHNLEVWGEPNFFPLLQLVFQKLLRYHHVSHIHPNNCCGILNLNGVDVPRVVEFSFVRKDRVSIEGFAKDFPHPLDSANIPSRADLPLPECWIR